jgi:hypothetical protein
MRPPREILSTTEQLPERTFKPSAIESVVGRRRIGEMTADEYLEVAAACHEAIAKARE